MDDDVAEIVAGLPKGGITKFINDAIRKTDLPKNLEERLQRLENQIYMYNKENEALARTMIRTDETLTSVYNKVEILHNIWKEKQNGNRD
jgi:hypothetical protein